MSKRPRTGKRLSRSAPQRPGRGKPETLDPSDWSAFRRSAHRILDDALDHVARVRRGPVWHALPDEPVSTRPSDTPPEDATPLSDVYRDFTAHVRAHALNNMHPRFFGWALGGGTPVGAIGDLLAALLNAPSLGGSQDAAAMIEEQVLRWWKAIVGFPADASGILVSGGSMANLIALTVARNSNAGHGVKESGLRSTSAPLVVYGSVETHFSVQRALEVLGIGSNQLRRIPLDASHRIDVGALRSAIEEDRAAGNLPFCVVGNAGTTSTGAVDDLEALAMVAKAQRLWFHVDGAIGIAAALSVRARPLLRGVELADSLAFDLHKWLQVPFAAGCVLVRSASEHAQTFSFSASYLANKPKDMFTERGIELTRPFRALKIWMSMRTHGLRQYRAVIDRALDLAAHLAGRIAAEPAWELLAPVSLNIVCFRCIAGANDEEARNRLNFQLAAELKRSGVALVSHEQLAHRICLRASISNHRTTARDIDAMLDELEKIAARLVAKQRAALTRK